MRAESGGTYGDVGGIGIDFDDDPLLPGHDVGFFPKGVQQAGHAAIVRVTGVKRQVRLPDNAFFQHERSGVDIIEKDRLIERSEKLGAYLHQKAKDILAKHSIVGEIRGKGLLLGIELVKDKQTREPFEPAASIEDKIHQKAMQRGCLIYTGNGTVDGINGAHLLVAPPFIITEEEIDTALQILDEAISKVEEELSAAGKR